MVKPGFEFQRAVLSGVLVLAVLGVLAFPIVFIDLADEHPQWSLWTHQAYSFAVLVFSGGATSYCFARTEGQSERFMLGVQGCGCLLVANPLSAFVVWFLVYPM